ncbi:hypothetical protein CPB85DRAFT_1299482 [Mucidula mucida]|nr:hypothetical protein CPB85DRAFT_1299482 [Mucidula mucida]
MEFRYLTRPAGYLIILLALYSICTFPKAQGLCEGELYWKHRAITEFTKFHGNLDDASQCLSYATSYRRSRSLPSGAYIVSDLIAPSGRHSSQ